MPQLDTGLKSSFCFDEYVENEDKKRFAQTNNEVYV